MKRFGLMMAAIVFASGAALMVSVPAASASYGPLAEYQVALSMNCNGPSNLAYCGGGFGGNWGWGVFNSDGTGELQITFCGHLPGQGGGAGHEDVDIYSWTIDQSTGVFEILSASDPGFEGDSPIPAAPGHYNQHPAPGVNMEITVAKIPSH